MDIPSHRTYSIMVAISQNGLIALQSGELPFNIPKDKEYYLNMIKNKVWIQARGSFENGPSNLLETKHNFILTRNHSYQSKIKNTTSVSSLAEALMKASQITESGDEIFIGGGMALYADALSFVDKIYITRVHEDVLGGGAFFPSFDWTQWKRTSSQFNKNDNGADFTFEIYERL